MAVALFDKMILAGTTQNDMVTKRQELRTLHSMPMS